MRRMPMTIATVSAVPDAVFTGVVVVDLVVVVVVDDVDDFVVVVCGVVVVAAKQLLSICWMMLYDEQDAYLCSDR